MSVNDRDEFDKILLGGGGPAYFSFGKQPVPGQYIEGVVVEKKSRHKHKFQTKGQRDAGLPVEYEYFVGKAKTTSTLPFEEYVKQVPNAKPVWELILVLQTNLRDPAKEKDDGLRTFVFPWRAQALLAERVRAQNGQEGGLLLGSFVRVALSALIPVEGLETPQREYDVQLWGPGEQPSPSPAQPQPVYTPPPVQQPAQPVYQQPVQQQPVYQQPAQQYAPPPVQQQPAHQNLQALNQMIATGGGGGQLPAPVVQQAAAPSQYPQMTQEVLDIMKAQGMPAPPGYPNYLLSDQGR